VVIVGVGSLVAFGGGQHDQAVSPGTKASSSASAPTSQSAAVGQPTVVVDLKHHSMTIHDRKRGADGDFPVTGGTAEHPTRPGVYTVSAKQRELAVKGLPLYTVKAEWVIVLDGGPSVYAMPWAGAKAGLTDSTHGDIGLTTNDAQWLYDHVDVGEVVEIR